MELQQNNEHQRYRGSSNGCKWNWGGQISLIEIDLMMWNLAVVVWEPRIGTKSVGRQRKLCVMSLNVKCDARGLQHPQKGKRGENS